MAYFDLQVNGYAGVDFNGDEWTIEQLEAACLRLARDDVDGILATIITDSLDAMCERLRRCVQARERSPVIAQRIVGFHIEGPFLDPSPGFIGAHPAHHAQAANQQALDRLLDAAGGLTRIVTLAPEHDAGLRITRALTEQGIVVSAGHCNPSHDQLHAAIDAGLSMFTHLGNGCPLSLPRHDNIIQRALAFAEQLWIGWIADGVHIPFFALNNYLRAAGLERTFIVTDAIGATGLGPGTYTLGARPVVVDERGATWSPDRAHLMGAATPMPRVATYLRRELNLEAQAIERLTWTNPRRAIGIRD